jgi:fibronectin type 3 domain-containing protein
MVLEIPGEQTLYRLSKRRKKKGRSIMNIDKKKLLKNLTIMVICSCLINMGICGDVKLLWDASPSESVTGYKVYYGNASRVYTTHTDIPKQTAYTVTNLTPATWYFAVTALDTEGNESDFSNEVSKVISTATNLSITSMAASLNWYGVVLQCTTSEHTSAILKYSLVQPNSGWTTVIATPTVSKTKHRAVLYMPTKQ